MKIGIVLSSPPAYSETFFRSKIKGLQGNGHQVILITAKSRNTFDLCTHKTHPKVYCNKIIQIGAMFLVGLSLLPYWGRIKNYYRLEKKERTSVKRIIEKIYINATLLKLEVDWLHFGFATMALERELVAKAINAKMAVSFRGYDIGVYPLKNPNCYAKLWRYLDKVHYISNDLYQKALYLGLSKVTPASKITPAIDVSFFSAETKKIKNKSKAISFLTIGRLHWKKGYVEALAALKQLKEQGFNFTYTIIGAGSDQEKIAYTAYEYGLSDKVSFLGKIPPKEVKEQLAAADIYLQYSVQEGFCNAVLEAQAMGKLCVVSDAEGLSENVLHDYSGWVVPKLKPELLAKKLFEVSKLTQNQRRKITQQAQERVKNSFTLQEQKEDFNMFYLV